MTRRSSFVTGVPASQFTVAAEAIREAKYMINLIKEFKSLEKMQLRLRQFLLEHNDNVEIAGAITEQIEAIDNAMQQTIRDIDALRK